jgi:Na+-driven multidrug efflux pump
MVALDLVLIPKFGINGAAIASSVSYISATIFMIVVYRRISNNSVRSLLIPKHADLEFMKNLFIRVIGSRSPGSIHS